MANILILPNLQKQIDNQKLSLEDLSPAYNTDVGLDLYNAGPDIKIPSFTLSDCKWYSNGYEFRWSAENRIMIPTGLKLHLEPGWGGFIEERGSVSKSPLKVRAGVIDPSYTGEMFINCVNLSPISWVITEGQKLPFQLVIKRCDTSFNIISEEEYQQLTKDSTRKDRKLGSSD